MAKKVYQVLPNGQKIPGFGYGTFLAQDPAELERALETALENGYRHIDTAYIYLNEAVVGKVVNKWISSKKLKREEIFITTKVPPYGVHQDRIEIFLNRSLKNLQLDYVDLYLLHTPFALKYTEGNDSIQSNNETEIEPVTDHKAIWKKMEEQVDAGKAKNIGLSNFNISQIGKILGYARIKPANLQVELNLYLQQPELVKYCKDNGITVVGYCPLANPGRNQSNPKWKNVLEDSTVARLSEKYQKTNAQILLRFMVDLGIIPIPKSVTPQRIIENINIFDFKLTNEEVNTLKKLNIGESARNVRMDAFKGVSTLAEYPFPRQ